MSTNIDRVFGRSVRTALAGMIALLLIAAQAFAADEEAQKTISRGFNVEPGGDLTVEADQGDVRITTSDKNEVEVEVERDTPGLSESRAKALLKKHKVRMSHDDNTVRVETGLERSHSLFSHSQPELNVHIRITVPRRFNVSVTTAGGGIDVERLRGTVDVQSSGGDLHFAKIDGTIDGHTSGGNIRAEDCRDKLLAQTSGGSIIIKNYTGPSATADTMGGNIEVSDCEGRLQAKTSGGNITVGNFTGAGVFADTTGGTISFDMAKQPQDTSTLRTSGGNVNVRLPADIAVNINASTDGGNVNTEIPVASSLQPGKEKEGHLEGKINGGGPMLALRTSGGNIDISKR